MYKLRTGCPWRDVPSYFGKWNYVFKRFSDWSRLGKLENIFRTLATEPDLEWEFIDGSLVKAHQHSSGARRGEETGIGKSRGGNTTKIHLAVDAHGMPIEFEITGGQVHDCKLAPDFIAKLPTAEWLIADKGYDSEALRTQIKGQGMKPEIPRKSNSKKGNDDMDWGLYKVQVSRRECIRTS